MSPPSSCPAAWHPVAWLVALTAIGGGVAAVTAQAVALWARDAGEGAVPPQWTILQSTAWVPGTLSLILVVPYLVSGRRLSPVARWAIGAGTAVIVAVLALRLTDPGPGRRTASRTRRSPCAVRPGPGWPSH